MAEFIVSSDNIDLENEKPFDPGTETGGIFDLIQGGKRSRSFIDRNAVDVAKVRAATKQTDFMDEYHLAFNEISMGGDPSEMRSIAYDNYVAATNTQVDQFILDNAGTSDPNLRAHIDTIITNRNGYFQDSLEQKFEANGYDKLAASILAGPTATDYEKRFEASKSYAEKLLAEYTDTMGFGDYTSSFLSMLFIPQAAKDAADLTGKGEFATATGRSRFIREWQRLDPDVQVALLPSVFERVRDAYDDNVFHVGGMIQAMYSRDYVEDEMWGIVSDVLAVPDLIGVGKLAKFLALKAGKAVSVKAAQIPEISVAKAHGADRNMAMDAQNLGNDQTAAEIVVASAADRNAGNVMGMSSLDAALSVSPFRTSELPIVANSIDNVADVVDDLAVASVDKEVARILRDTTDPVPQAVQREVAKASVEIPREIARTKVLIEGLDKKISQLRKAPRKKGKTKDAKDVQISDLSAELAFQIRKLKTLDEQLASTNRTLDSIKKRKGNMAVVKALRSGVKLNPLAKAIRSENAVIAGVEDAVQAATKAAQDAPRVAKNVDEVRKIKAAETSEVVADVAVKSGIAKLIERLKDNPAKFGLNPEYVAFMARFFEDAGKLVDQADRLAISGLSNADKKAIQDRVIKDIVTKAEQADETVRVADITDITDTGFTVTFHANNVEKTRVHHYSVDDVNLFSEVSEVPSSLRHYFGFLLSPETMFRDLDKHLVDNVTFAESQAANIANRLKKMFDETRKGLDKKQNEQLDVLLMAGDETEEVFSLEKLEGGVIPTVEGKIKYDRQVIDAYYKSRLFYDELHSARNHFTHKQMTFLGYKNIDYVDASGEVVQAAGKIKDDFRGLTVADNDLIFFPNDLTRPGYSGYRQYKTFQGKWGNLRNEGYKVVELIEPHKLDSGFVKYAVIKEEGPLKITALPKQVLHYVPGYIPRIYRPGYHFVKDFTNPAAPNTLFAAETDAIAQKLANELRQTDEGRKVVVLQDNEVKGTDLLMADAEQYGGLYFGARKKVNLVNKALDGSESKLERASVVDATERYMNNLSTFMPMAEYRHSLMQSFVNSVEHLGKVTNRDGFKGERNFLGEIDLPPDKKALMESARDYIKAQLSISDNETKLLNQVTLKVTDAMYNNKQQSSAFRKFLLGNVYDADPVRELKGFSFNLMLGALNARQLVVQASNAAVAALIDPVNGLRAFAEALPMRMAILSDREEVWRAAAKFSTVSADEYVEMIRKFRESGLLDSIKRQGDYDARNLTLDGNLVKTTRKAAEAGRIFFTEGELFSRIVSFNIATKRLGAGASTQDIFQETLRLTFNMQAANQAKWQKGALGIPTQYQQVYSKFLERVLPDMILGKSKWTTGEKLRVTAGMFALYGTSGVWLADEVAAFYADSQGMSVKEFQEQNPLVKEAVDEGLTGLLTSVLGFENNFSSSLNILSGFDDGFMPVVLVSALLNGIEDGRSEQDLYTTLLGPSGNVVRRVGDSWSQIIESARVLNYNPTIDQLGNEVINIADSVAAWTATWSNAQKTVMLHDVGLRSKSGSKLIDPQRFEEFNIQSSLARAMSFPFDIEDSYWKTKEVAKIRRQNRADTIAILRKEWIRSNGDINRFNNAFATFTAGMTSAETRELRKIILSGETGKADEDRLATEVTSRFMISGGRMTAPTELER